MAKVWDENHLVVTIGGGGTVSVDRVFIQGHDPFTYMTTRPISWVQFWTSSSWKYCNTIMVERYITLFVAHRCRVILKSVTRQDGGWLPLLPLYRLNWWGSVQWLKTGTRTVLFDLASLQTQNYRSFPLLLHGIYIGLVLYMFLLLLSQSVFVHWNSTVRIWLTSMSVNMHFYLVFWIAMTQACSPAEEVLSATRYN